MKILFIFTLSFFLTLYMPPVFSSFSSNEQVISSYRIVHTTYGPIRGFSNENGTFFLGVPFAQPPIGPLRWKAPQEPNPWLVPIDTLQYSAICVQNPPSSLVKFNISEDCLYLNIYIPPGDNDDVFPVMFWIFGGSFVEGSGEFYDGISFSRKHKVIVVNFNYRLGPFGFLALTELQKEDSNYPSTGFYGIQDQRAALKWVKNNIGNFGGDPNHILVFGESAGAISICAHLAASKSAGLFQAALMESGFCTINELPISLIQGSYLVGNLSCENSDPSQLLSCLRNKPTYSIFKALPSNTSWFPVIDGYELNQQPIQYLKDGHFNKVPLLIGTNLNEDSLFLCPTYANITKDSYIKLVLQYFGTDIGNKLLQLYPVENYPLPVNALTDMFSDKIFICPSKQAADLISANGIPTFFYSFQHQPSFSVGNCLHVAHSFELPFIYPTMLPYFAGNHSFTLDELTLSADMREFWSHFAKFYNPNPEPSQLWPHYSPNGPFLILNIEHKVDHSLREKYCQFWNQI